jgi:hypothetical protein
VRRERGQAAVELVAVAALLGAVAVGTADALRVVRAVDAAERLAGQAAVLAAEGRPLPAGLRRGVRVAGGVATAEVRVCAVTAGVGCFRVRASAAVP